MNLELRAAYCDECHCAFRQCVKASKHKVCHARPSTENMDYDTPIMLLENQLQPLRRKQIPKQYPKRQSVKQDMK